MKGLSYLSEEDVLHIMTATDPADLKQRGNEVYFRHQERASVGEYEKTTNAVGEEINQVQAKFLGFDPKLLD